MRFRLSAMWQDVKPGRRRTLLSVGTAAVLIAAVGVVHYGARADTSSAGPGTASTQGPVPPAHGEMATAVELSDGQLGMIRVGAVAEQTFPLEHDAIGSIDFNEDMAAQVFPPYQGRIVRLFATMGDNVRRGQPLLTIESPDLIQAESALIAAAGVLDLTAQTLARARQLYEVQGLAEKDLQQAVSDQQTAEGALRAARHGVAVFGKSDVEIDRVVKTRSIDPYLVVLSPMTGRVTARSAAPGDFVQPGNAPAPYAVADLSRVWLNASVSESDMPLIHKGERVHVTVLALPGRAFDGDVSMVGAAVDPQLHRGLVRAELPDPKHELLPGMLASFVIVTGEPVRAVAVPLDGVVREGDGSMTVWSAADDHHYVRKTVKVGLQHAGYDQILDGVSAGEQVVTKGAVFLDNLVADKES